MFGRIECILQGETTEIGLESTVVDCTEETPLLLRQGAISIEELRKVVPGTLVYRPAAGDAIRSPGLKHRHYSPRAKVVILSRDMQIADSTRAAFIGLNEQSAGFKTMRLCISVEEYAHELYEFLRQCDRVSMEVIYCESVAEIRIGAALMDRLRRAAED